MFTIIRNAFQHKRNGSHAGQSVRSTIYAPDRIGLVGFHDRGFVIARPAESHSPWLQQRIQQVHTRIAGDGTNITDGLRTAVGLLSGAPSGVLRRIWLLSDGYPNLEESRINEVLQQARQAYINVNTIGFGHSYDQSLLRGIASQTHNGRFVPVADLQQLTEALVAAGGGRDRHQNQRSHRSEITIVAVDLSVSMREPMGSRTKIEVVEQALLQLLLYKQRCFS